MKKVDQQAKENKLLEEALIKSERVCGKLQWERHLDKELTGKKIIGLIKVVKILLKIL